MQFCAKQVELLTAQIARLEEELASYQKTSGLKKKQPDFIKPNVPHRRKKPGQLKGHKGTSCFRPKEANETVNLTLSYCPNCSKPLLKSFGNGLSLPYRKVASALLHLSGLAVTPGGLTQAIQRFTPCFQPEISSIKEDLRKSNFVHSDETGWFLGYRNHWLWVFTTDKVTLYQINKSRGHKVVKKILGKGFKGTLIADFYTAYNPLPYKHQKCLAHLFRELAECRTNTQEFFAFRKKLSRLLHDGMRLAIHRKELEKNIFLQRQKRIELRLMKIISTSYQDSDCQRLKIRLLKHKEAIFTFLREADVEPTNNRAERALRQNVISRKISFGNYSSSGATVQTTITSLIETCRQQGRDFIQYGLEFIQSHLSGKPIPLLISTSIRDP